jgi:hypothetical protein
MRYAIDGIKENVILRKPQSGCLEGCTALIQPIFDIFTRLEAGTHVRDEYRLSPA